MLYSFGNVHQRKDNREDGNKKVATQKKHNGENTQHVFASPFVAHGKLR
jgi:hypothetical protein